MLTIGAYSGGIGGWNYVLDGIVLFDASLPGGFCHVHGRVCFLDAAQSWGAEAIHWTGAASGTMRWRVKIVHGSSNAMSKTMKNIKSEAKLPVPRVRYTTILRCRFGRSKERLTPRVAHRVEAVEPLTLTIGEAQRRGGWSHCIVRLWSSVACHGAKEWDWVLSAPSMGVTV